MLDRCRHRSQCWPWYPCGHVNETRQAGERRTDARSRGTIAPRTCTASTARASRGLWCDGGIKPTHGKERARACAGAITSPWQGAHARWELGERARDAWQHVGQSFLHILGSSPVT